jgi:hypothetical protein
LAAHVQEAVRGSHSTGILPTSAVQARAMQPSRLAGAPQPGFHGGLVIQRVRVSLEEAKTKVSHQFENYQALGLKQQNDWNAGLHDRNEDWISEEDAGTLQEWWLQKYPISYENTGFYKEGRHRNQNPYHYPMLLLQGRDNVGAPLFNFHIPVISRKDEEEEERKRLLLEEEKVRRTKESMFLGSSSTGVDLVWEDANELKEKEEEPNIHLAPREEGIFEREARQERKGLQVELGKVVDEQINPVLTSLLERQKAWRNLIGTLPGKQQEDHSFGFNFWEKEKVEINKGFKKMSSINVMS